MLRNAADVRTLFWALVLFPLIPVLGLTAPRALFWLIAPAFYLSYCVGILAHNQTHVPVFRSRWANHAYAAWLSVFYGCPIAVWIPTHLENHHRFLDGPEDVTRTTRLSPRHGLWPALAYSFSCVRWQRPLIERYVRRAYAGGGQHWVALRLQFVTMLGAHAGVFALALWLRGPALGMLTYALCMGVPALSASIFMQFTNYVQHIHCDSTSSDNHSRDFVSPLVNWLMFDNGYHSVHHDRPSVHWSRYAELHRQRAGRIHPELQKHNMLGFCLQNYVLGPFLPRFRTRALRTQPST